MLLIRTKNYCKLSSIYLADLTYDTELDYRLYQTLFHEEMNAVQGPKLWMWVFFSRTWIGTYYHRNPFLFYISKQILLAFPHIKQLGSFYLYILPTKLEFQIFFFIMSYHISSVKKAFIKPLFSLLSFWRHINTPVYICLCFMMEIFIVVQIAVVGSRTWKLKEN